MTIPARLRREALARNGGRCFNCEQRAEHAHHIVPRARGGSDLLTNLASLCETCHGKVHGRDMTEHSALTRRGLAAAKARGVKLGGKLEAQKEAAAVRSAQARKEAEALRPVLEPLVATGASLRKISAALAAAGTTTATGAPLSATQVKRLVARLQEQG